MPNPTHTTKVSSPRIWKEKKKKNPKSMGILYSFFYFFLVTRKYDPVRWLTHSRIFTTLTAELWGRNRCFPFSNPIQNTNKNTLSRDSNPILSCLSRWYVGVRNSIGGNHAGLYYKLLQTNNALYARYETCSDRPVVTGFLEPSLLFFLLKKQSCLHSSIGSAIKQPAAF